MSAALSPPSFLNRRTALGAIIVAGVALAAWSFQDSRARDRERAETELVRRTTIQHTLMREVLGRYEDALFGLSALFTVDANVTLPEFLRAASRLQERTPGALAFEWVPLVTAAQRAGFEAALQASYPGRTFAFTEFDPAGPPRRAGDRPAYLPIGYIQPLEGSEAALGFDLMTGPTRAFLEQARTTRRITLTGQVRLLQAPAGRLGLVMISPVWRTSRPDQPAGSEAFLGYVQAVFLAQDLLEHARATHPDPVVDLLFIDDSATDPAERVLYYHPADRGRPDEAGDIEAAFRRGLHYEYPIPIGGRDWRVLYRPRAGWVEQQFTPLAWVRTAGVLTITLLLAGLIRSLSRRTTRIEHEVAERTAELAESRRELDTLLHALPGAAFRCLFDEHMTALFVSEGMLPLTGYPAEDYIAGRCHIAGLTLPADRPVVRAAVTGAMQQRQPFEVEYRFAHRDGREKWVLVRGRPIHAADGRFRFLEGLAIDVTALKLAEQEKLAIERQLLEAQKLESLGVLAGGIAHDFNNILTTVLMNATLARRVTDAAGPVTPHLAQIEEAARRATDLCQQMLAYAGKGKLVTDRIDLSALVRDTATLLEVTIRKSTRLDLRLADRLPPVLADATQLRQIVMNLVLNAADAIGEKPGVVTVTTCAQAADAAFLRTALGHPELPSGTYVGLEVTDNGAGMPPETIARIFEPFFSTKFSGRGLGLAAVRGIVQAHRGALFVGSQPGTGSTFRLLLPATSGAAGASATPFPAPSSAPVKLAGLVLVVDDEPSVRNIVAAVLEAHGATVLAAADGEAALALLRAHADRVALILLDMTMPGLSGEETLRRFRMANSRHPVILMSGFSEAQTMKRTTDLGVAGFVQKPFEIGTFLASVRPFLT